MARLEVAARAPGSRGQASDPLLVAALTDRLRFRVAQQHPHLGAGGGLLRQLVGEVGVAVEEEQPRVDEDLNVAGGPLDQR
ncbi:hypothetical protein ACH5AL_02050 [Actinacidiphila glaucinigra]|uniref:hypothetical protein n=1 Tax=Actinacidiphila glaucinigra TaxID=235986 RepID=UPI0037BA71FA